jgi:thioesterase domain-containing protein
LTSIWANVLGRNHIGLDDNFFDLGGHSVLVAALQQRISTEFGPRLSIVELLQNPTVRLQTALMLKSLKETSVLPDGVVALKARGAQGTIFWVHYLHTGLASIFADDYAFLSVTLTGEDISSLGEAPTAQPIGRRLLEKIVAVQPNGPYIIGGLCACGVLAYEIAIQLRAAGREVSLLILLDVPSPSYLELPAPLTPRLRNPRYFLTRIARLGLLLSLAKLRERIFKDLAGSRAKSAKSNMDIAQEMIEAAAHGYKPQIYDRRTLLLLASDRPPHVNFLYGWQAVIPHNLESEYIPGHHTEILRAPHVKCVADAIVSHLRPNGNDSAKANRRQTSEARARRLSLEVEGDRTVLEGLR